MAAWLRRSKVAKDSEYSILNGRGNISLSFQQHSPKKQLYNNKEKEVKVIKIEK